MSCGVAQDIVLLIFVPEDPGYFNYKPDLFYFLINVREWDTLLWPHMLRLF